MSEHNKKIVLEFVSKHMPELKQLRKFKDAVTPEQFMDCMKLTVEDMNVLLKLYDVIEVPENSMFAHTESTCNRGDVRTEYAAGQQKMSISNFWEMTPTIYHGTMSCTSCWSNDDLDKKARHGGLKFNISANTTFLGKYYDCFGRILIYRSRLPIKMLNLGVANLYGRKAFTYIITRLILGNDYNMDLKGNGFENPQEPCKGCMSDCTTGLWSQLGALYEKTWGYFMELAYLENKMSVRIGGIIINDASNDKLEQLYVSGTEFRVFSTETMFTLESVLYNDRFYLNKEVYRLALEEDINKFDPNNPKEYKKLPDIKIGERVDALLDTYCKSRVKLGFDKNDFEHPNPNLPSKGDFKVQSVSQVVFNTSNIETPSYEEALHGYDKYKTKYIELAKQAGGQRKHK